jgi:hypothetical protein
MDKANAAVAKYMKNSRRQAAHKTKEIDYEN